MNQRPFYLIDSKKKMSHFNKSKCFIIDLLFTRTICHIEIRNQQTRQKSVNHLG